MSLELHPHGPMRSRSYCTDYSEWSGSGPGLIISRMHNTHHTDVVRVNIQ